MSVHQVTSTCRSPERPGVQIWPVFLPVVPLGSAAGGYMEALMRTDHPAGHQSLIRDAERDGTMWELDVAMLSCVRKLMVMTEADLRFGLNVSAITIQENPQAWLSRLNALSDGTGQRLVVELTETAVHRSPERTLAFAAACREMGAAIAVDDYDANTFDDDLVYQLAPDYIKVGDAWAGGEADRMGCRLRTSLSRIARLGVDNVVVEWIDSDVRRVVAENLGVRHLQGTHMAPHFQVDDVLEMHGWQSEGERMAHG